MDKKEYYKFYSKTHKKELLERNKIYRDKNKQKIADRKKAYYIKHREEISRYGKIYRETHKKEIANRKKIDHREKYNTNIKFRIKQSIKTLINKKLKKRLLSKNNKSTFTILPYTIEDLMSHLEKQFKPGMSWNNRNKWHIDHKKPDSLFEYTSTNDEEFKKCWALENLQPLWALENLQKYNKYDTGVEQFGSSAAS